MPNKRKDLMQDIYFNLDDSGKLTDREKVCVYGGLVFLSKAEKDKFITQYRAIVSEIRCKYCDHTESCDHKCPEIKNTNIKPKHKRRLMNYIKKYLVIALVIKNESVFARIKEDKGARGRFTDFSIRLLIKTVIQGLIKDKRINPHLPVHIIINIDEQTTKNNGYYDLRSGLIEELRYGISNFNYSVVFLPILHGDLDISLTYHDSKNSYVVQAADLLAGTIRRSALQALQEHADIASAISDLVKYIVIMPLKKA